MTMKTCIIPTCGARFQSSRSDARYCSPKCRAKASRLRAKGEEIPRNDRKRPPESAKLDDSTARTIGRDTTKTKTGHPGAPDASSPEDHLSPPRLQARIEGLGRALKGLRRELRDLRSWCERQPDPQDVHAEVKALRRDMERMDAEKVSPGLRRRLAKLEEAIPSITKLNRIEGELSRLSSKMSELDREPHEQQTGTGEIAQLKERLDDHEGHIMALAKRDWVLFHGLEEAGVEVEFEDG